MGDAAPDALPEPGVAHHLGGVGGQTHFEHQQGGHQVEGDEHDEGAGESVELDHQAAGQRSQEFCRRCW